MFWSKLLCQLCSCIVSNKFEFQSLFVGKLVSFSVNLGFAVIFRHLLTAQIENYLHKSATVLLESAFLLSPIMYSFHIFTEVVCTHVPA